MSTRSLPLAGLAAALALSALATEHPKQVYDLPDGARPHDVAPAPDGSVWYTAQRQGALGILDPASGAIRQVQLGPDSAPHGVIAGPDGAAWITDGGQNAIVR
jgi:virginiamycin B lyase